MVAEEVAEEAAPAKPKLPTERIKRPVRPDEAGSEVKTAIDALQATSACGRPWRSSAPLD